VASISIPTAALAAGSLVSTAAGAVISYQGAHQSAAAQSAALNYQAQVARNNATIAAQNAQTATQAGDVAAQNKLIETGQRTSSIRAAAGASGIDANTGSPLALQETNQKLGMLDALTIRNAAARQAYGYRVEGLSETAQSQLSASGASNAATAGAIAGAGSLVGGATDVADKWIIFKNRGLLT
jgi:hypothetical protein